MFSSHITNTPARQQGNSQEPRSLESTTAVKAFKFAAYSTVA